MRSIEIMKANINPKIQNPNYLKVKVFTGTDRKTLASWQKNREAIASSKYKHSREKLTSAKFKGKYPEMENKLDEWTQELREAGCCVSGFTLKVKTLQIQKRCRNIMGHFLPRMGGYEDFYIEHTILLEESLQPVDIYPLILNNIFITNLINF